MLNNEKAALSVRKIAFITLLFIFLFSACVLATDIKLQDVKIILSNKCEMNILTTKTKVADILDEGHIFVLPDEHVVPNMDSDIDETNTITITKISDSGSFVKIAEENEDISLEQLLGNYAPVIEKIITEQVAIPYETEVKESSSSGDETVTKLLKEGKDGIKEITYKAKYKNNEEIERSVIEEKVIEEPINKVIQVSKKTTSRNTSSRKNSNI